jgi:hypothetical protein
LTNRALWANASSLFIHVTVRALEAYHHTRVGI